jgi:hypothetical protein
MTEKQKSHLKDTNVFLKLVVINEPVKKKDKEKGPHEMMDC